MCFVGFLSPFGAAAHRASRSSSLVAVGTLRPRSSLASRVHLERLGRTEVQVLYVRALCLLLPKNGGRRKHLQTPRLTDYPSCPFPQHLLLSGNGGKIIVHILLFCL